MYIFNRFAVREEIIQFMKIQITKDELNYIFTSLADSASNEVRMATRTEGSKRHSHIMKSNEFNNVLSKVQLLIEGDTIEIK